MSKTGSTNLVFYTGYIVPDQGSHYWEVHGELRGLVFQLSLLKLHSSLFKQVRS